MAPQSIQAKRREKDFQSVKSGLLKGIFFFYDGHVLLLKPETVAICRWIRDDFG